MREPGRGENIPAFPERAQGRPRYTRGLALFALGPNFWDKTSITSSEVDSRMEHVWPVEVYRQFAIVDAVSNDERGGRVPTTAEVRTWIEADMPSFLQGMRQMDAPSAQEIKQVLKKNFHIDIDRSGSDADVLRYFQNKSAWLWKTFFADGQSNTGEFVRTLTRDVLWTNREDFDRRIVIARPLYGLFGGEETAILLEHAALAYDHVYDHEKPEFTAWTKRAVQIPFSSPVEENAYRLAAEKIITIPSESNWRLRRKEEEMGTRAPPAQRLDTTLRAQPAPVETLASQQRTQTEPVRKGTSYASPQEPPSQPSSQMPPVGETRPVPSSTLLDEISQRRAAPTVPRAESVPQTPAEAPVRREQEGKPQYLTAHEIAASPHHPKFSADRALAMPIAGGESVLVSAIDGIGSGEEYSVEPAHIMERALHEEMQHIAHMPTIKEGLVALVKAYYQTAIKIEDYQESLKGKRVREKVREQVGTVGSSALVCREQNRDFLVAMNLGDSRVYVFYPQSQELKQVTQDHNVPQLLANRGSLSAHDAFLDRRRNSIYKSVTVSSVADMLMHLVSGERSDDYFVTPLSSVPHLIFATTDGWTDNTPPEWEKERVSEAYEEAIRGGNFDARIFTHHLIEGTRYIMQQKNGTIIPGSPPYNVNDFVKKDDLGIAVAYRQAKNDSNKSSS